MIKNILGPLAALLISTSVSFATEHTNKIVGCTTKDNIEKLLNEEGFLPFSRGTTPDNKTHEVWLNVKNQMIVVAFDKPPNNDSKLIKEVCVISMTTDESYNGDTVSMLNKAFNGQDGQKI